MPNSSLRTLVFALACLVAAGTAHAQSSSANSSIADAISAAERGQPVDAARFANDPLYGWLAYASLRRNIDTLPTDQAQSFLSRHEGQAVADTFRSVWLARSEEHTSELQSLMRISYAVLCLKKKTTIPNLHH